MGGEHPPSSWAEEKLHLHLMCDVEMVLIAHLMERGLRFFIFSVYSSFFYFFRFDVVFWKRLRLNQLGNGRLESKK